MKENILKKLELIIGEMVSEDVIEDFNEETNLLTDYGFDSIMLVQFVAEIEEVFNITFKDEDMDVDKLFKVASLIECIQNYL